MTLLRTLTGLALGALPLLLAQSAFAQDDFEDAAALGVCAAMSGALIMIPIVIIAVNIAMIVWVAKDSKARGMENSIVWVLLVFFTSVLGLVIYILSRPKGDKVACASCSNMRLQSLVKCPHCGNA
ncbi:MAG: PLDc N-terminal domain-containing protein [Acidobacteria bacterium]|nr:PLDc N-terminal domain-containing protein [Acidobacteriota bacterium]MDA1236103.1 PLDc N-terminal domain-containing protein [Acidobacteriota bacterium]